MTSMAATRVADPIGEATVTRPNPGWSGPAALVLLVLALRLPSLFEPHHYGDEGVFAATAQRLLQGETLYTGAWDNKSPLVFLVYAAVLGLFGPSMLALRLVGVAWSVGTALAVRAIARRTGGGAGRVAAVVYALLAAVPFIEGTLLLTEALMALPVALAVLATLDAVGREGRRRTLWFLAAGVLLGVGFLFKQVAALDAAAVGLWLLCRRERPVRDAAVLLTGWTVAVGMAALWLAAEGALGEGWHAVLGFYGLYLGEGSVLPPLLALLRFVPATAAVLWCVRRRVRGGMVGGGDLILLWFGFALLGATAAGRPFGHYLVQVLAPAALLVADLTRRWRSERQRRVRSILLLLALVIILPTFRGFWLGHASVAPAYYGNWLAWVVGARTRSAHDRFYSWRVPNQQALAQLIEQDAGWSSGGERTLFVWGEYPWLYPLTDAHNPTRYATTYQTAFLPGAKDEVMQALERDPPRYIVRELEEWRRLPGLDAFLAAQYERVAQVDNTMLWRRR